MEKEQLSIDHAAGKIARELCNHPQYMTAKGDCEPYGTNLKQHGYLGIHHPANVTLDLTPPQESDNIQSGKTVEVKQISIKFMSDKDELNRTKMEGQAYAFRLLCSNDGICWKVLFDSTATKSPYRSGWVHFIFEGGVQEMKYFRVHALHNPVSSGFQIVRLRLFNAKTEMPPGEEIHLPMEDSYEYELHDTTPLATKLLNIAERLYHDTPQKYKESALTIHGVETNFNDLYNYIIEKAFELQAVDGKVDQVRKIITPLITQKLNKKQTDGIKSMRREWIIMLFLFIVYIGVNIICVKIRN